MLKGLTGAGIGKYDHLETFIALASANGFQAVDTSGAELRKWIEQKGADVANQYLRENHIQIGTIGLSLEWRASESTFQEGIARLVDDAQAAQALGCTSCTTYILPSTDQNPAHFLATATRRLRLAAQILHAHGIRLGLEFVGPHHLRNNWKYPFIWNLESTLEWIEAIHEPNVGLLLDAFHSYTTEPDFAHIAALRADQIVHVHINDAPDVPIADVRDNVRLYPGEGVIDLPAFLRAVASTGYQGVVSQEILTAEPIQEDASILIPKSAAAFANVWPEDL